MNYKILNRLYSFYGLLFFAILFFAFSYIFNSLYSDKTSVKREAVLLQEYISKNEKRFEKLAANTALVQNLVVGKTSEDEIKKLADEPFGFYVFYTNVYGVTEAKFWSNQLAMPNESDFFEADGEKFQNSFSNGAYVQIKKTVNLNGINGKALVFALIPVYSVYFITNDYLPKEFFYSKEAVKRITISLEATDFPIQSLSGKDLFYITKASAAAVPYNSWLTIFLRLAGLFFLLIFFHFLSEKISVRYGVWAGILVLICLLSAVRIIMVSFPVIFNFRQFKLFDPAIYGSTSSLQNSLGDLLINALLFCWIVVYIGSKTKNKEPLVGIRNNTQKWVIGIIALIALIVATFFLSSIIRSLVADSKISFDVTDFFSLTIYSAIGFIVLASLSLAYYYLSQVLFRILFYVFRNQQPYMIYFIMILTGLFLLTFKFGSISILFYLPALGWLLIYTWIVQKQDFLFSRFGINIAGILFWIFIFSLSISIIMLYENGKMEWERRKSYAERIASQDDPSNVRTLNIAFDYLDGDFLSENYYRLTDPVQGQKLKDSIVNSNFKNYTRNFELKLYLFDSNEKPVNNNDPLDYESLDLVYSQSDTTLEPYIRYHETSYDKFNYLIKKVITDGSGKLLGTLFIISDPKRYGPDALLPELFKSSNKSDPQNSPLYAVAIYKDKQLITESNKYQFAYNLTDDDLLNTGTGYKKIKRKEYDELWFRADAQKIVVMARKRESLIEAISLFSYLFCAFLLLVSIVELVSFILTTQLRWRKIKERFRLNIRTQIHSTVIFVSLLSFVIIGFATISFFKERYLRNNSDKLSRTMRIMVNEMQKKQADLSVFDDVVKVYDSVSLHKLQNLVEEVSDIHDIDVNVYDMEGNLQVSSQAYVYNRGVLSRKMHPVAFFELARKRLIHYVQEEKISKLNYLSIYAPVRDDYGKVYAYLNIPYFALQRELNQDISNFLVTIINLNAFIFLIAGVIALFVTNRITNSFAVISDKMKAMSLGGKNEEIEWDRKDEIGDLVKEYNKMVAKLGESAAILAKSEREGAWREMARQVAHEIKNPLTPMKLSMQYLQKAIDTNQPNVKELSANVAKTLIEQIDHLSKIALDFSQFANIGNTNAEFFDLHDVLGSLKDLYQADPAISYSWHPVNNKVIVFADRTQMNRLFTNLIANAVEACNGKTACNLSVDEMREDGVIRVSIKDNGEGIPAEMQSKIFVPNFTTKTSGTGLGLAMCKGIAEQAKGKIWFDTEMGKGTTFHVELPVSN